MKAETAPVARPLVVFAGATGTAPAAVLDAALSEVGQVGEIGGAGEVGPIARLATANTWLLLRHGQERRVNAYLPGQRRARPLGPEGPPEGARPARRIEIEDPAKLLELIGVAGVPEVGDRDPAAVEVLSDVLDRATGLVFVIGPAPLEPAQVELLGDAVSRVDRVAFVLAGADPRSIVEIVAAQRTLLGGYAPALAEFPWYLVDGPGEGVADGPGDLAALRLLLAEWGSDAAVAPDTATRSDTGTRSGTGAPAVPRPRSGRRGAPAVPADDQRWREVLDTEIRNRRAAAGRLIANDLVGVLARCTRELAGGEGCQGLPAALDRELHALSVRATRRVRADAQAAIAAVCATLLGTGAGPEVLERVAAALPSCIEHDDAVGPSGNALLVTTTSGVATMAGRDALDGLAALGLPAEWDTPVVPIGVAVSASCYQLWQRRDGHRVAEGRRWLQQALRVVETELLRELDRRFADLHQGLGVIAADAVDHGFLLV